MFNKFYKNNLRSQSPDSIFVYIQLIFFMKVDRKELENIYNLVTSKDIECKALGIALYQQSSFRKYIRNKRYRYIYLKEVLNDSEFRFPLYTPRNNIICIHNMAWKLAIIIKDFLNNCLIIIKKNKKWRKQKNYKKF